MSTVVNVGAGALTLNGLDKGFDPWTEIKRLKKEKNAIILAHFYQAPEIQDLADFVGDSLDLSRKAATTDADMIVFCGVRFMAEVAKILSPEKTVVIPDADAGCSLEDSCPPEEFAKFRAAHPDHLSLTYINCSAAVKAHSDIIVTSSNAKYIIDQIPMDQPILFAPDRYLGAWLARETGRDMVLWDGSCIVHEQFSERELTRLKSQHPEALIVAHPECHDGILRHADHVGSTRSLIDFVEASKDQSFIVATEQHILHEMKKRAPGKIFLPAPGADGTCNCANCPFMELNTLEKIYLAMNNNAPRIEIDEDLRLKALGSLDKMLEMSPPIVTADVKQVRSA